MKIVSWNMAANTTSRGDAIHRSAWQKLVALDADVALVQEARVIDADLAAEMNTGGLDPKPWGSLVLSPHLSLVDATTLDVDGHGHVAAARVSIDRRDVALVSLHAATEPLGSVGHIEALLERLGDWIGGGSFILAGDFNSCRLAEERWPGWHHLELFERIEEDFGMLNCYWQLHHEEERTFWQHCRDEGWQFQDDHIFVSADLGLPRSCEVSDYALFRGISDHTPITADLDIG